MSKYLTKCRIIDVRVEQLASRKCLPDTSTYNVQIIIIIMGIPPYFYLFIIASTLSITCSKSRRNI